MEKILESILVVEGEETFHDRVSEAIKMLFGPTIEVLEVKSVNDALEIYQTEESDGHLTEVPQDTVPPYDCSKVKLLIVSGLNEINLASLITNFKQYGFDGQVIYLIDDFDHIEEKSARLTDVGVNSILSCPTVEDIKNALLEVFRPQPVSV